MSKTVRVSDKLYNYVCSKREGFDSFDKTSQKLHGIFKAEPKSPTLRTRRCKSMLDWAKEILLECGEASPQYIVDRMILQGWKPLKGGKTPKNTLYSMMLTSDKFVRTNPNKFSLVGLEPWTPQKYFKDLLVRVLLSAPNHGLDCKDGVERTAKMASLKPGDFAILKCGTVRYEKNIHFCRNVLVNEGLIYNGPRGYWQLTPKGVEYARSLITQNTT